MHMSTQLLLPHRFKLIGWILLVPATIAGILYLVFDTNDVLPGRAFALVNDSISNVHVTGIIETDLANTLIGCVFIIGAMFVGFSREKREDEFISGLRLSSLLWAVWVNYALLLLAFIFVWGFSFLQVMLYNMFTVLIIFIARFNYALYRARKLPADEK
jgi:hypothetical protein